MSLSIAVMLSVSFLLSAAPILEAQEPDSEMLANSILDAFSTSISTVSYEQEASMGETIALDAFGEFGRLTKDRQLLEYVNLVGNAVARVSNRPQTPYYFAVCENSDLNAFAVPGGYVFLTTGLLKLMKNEEELAGVLGHEIAHITQQHAIKMVRAQKIKVAAAGILFSLTTENKSPAKRADYASLIQDFSNIAQTGYGRKHESDSDKVGTEYAYRAGYRAEGLRDFLRTLSGLEGAGQNFSLFQTHHDHGKRITLLEKDLKKKKYVDIPFNSNLVERFKTNFLDRLP